MTFRGNNYAIDGEGEDRHNQNGQRLGSKGHRTRQRLIDATVDMLRTHGQRELTVAEVARAAQTSAATFYVYFESVSEAVLAALDPITQSTPELVELLEEDWVGIPGQGCAHKFVHLYCELWAKNETIYRVRNLAAEEGDQRFIAARIKAVRELINALAKNIARAQRQGRVADIIDPEAQAAAILVLVERLAAVRNLNASPSYERIQESAAEMVAFAMGARS